MTEPDFVKTLSNLDAWRQQAANGTAPQDAVLRKQFISDVEVRDDRSVKFIITTGDADRENDIINPDGWEVSSYLQNPVVLFAHDYDSLPVARTTSLEQQGDKLIAVAEFATAELNPMAERVFQMLKQGFLRGASVGFRPMSFAFNDARGGVDFAKQELLEFSIVPIPANAQALMAAGLSDEDSTLLTDWAKDVLARLDPDSLREVVPDVIKDVAPCDVPEEATPVDVIAEDGFQQTILDTLRRIETGLSERVTLLEDDAVVLELDDETDRHDDKSVDDEQLIDVDATELATAMRAAMQETVGNIVGAEMRSAINAMRGRLDY